MRALVGALLGLVVAAIAVAGLGIAFGRGAYWSVLVAGVLAGFVMRALAAGSGSMYLKGALAAVVTALAAVTGPMIATEWHRSQTPKGSPIAAKAPVAEAEDGEEAEGEAAEPVEEVVIEPIASTPGPGSLNMNQQAKDPFAAADIACLAIGCLLAYQIGKGEGAGKPAEEGEGSGDEAADPSEPAAEAPADDDANRSE